LGYIGETFNASGIKIPKDNEDFDPNDEAVPKSEISGQSFDASFGIYYGNSKFYAGLSATHLLSPQLVLNDEYVLEIPRSYYFLAGYNIQLNNPLLELRPSVLVKTTELSSFFIEGDSLTPVVKGNTFRGMLTQTQIDVSLRLIYSKMFWGGLSWRNKDAIVVMLGGQFKSFQVGYSYDCPISNIIKESWGSHELFLKYTIEIDKKKNIKNKHKSVRIL
jgi:type IX secretion system PorP/SprF family membrane protein